MVPPPRNRYADLLRVLAIGMVVLGHWLLTSIKYADGRLSGIDAMSDIGWSGLGTLVFQCPRAAACRPGRSPRMAAGWS